MSWHLLAATAAAIAMRYKSGFPVRQTVKPFIGADPHSLELRPSPINPEWVLSGDPQARVASHSDAEDGCGATGVWDCTAGSFRWFFGWDETVVILEGEVHVTAEDGTQRVLRAGDVGYFRGGTWATWHVETYVKKIAFLRRPFPAPVAFLYKMKNAIRAKAHTALAA